VTIWNQAIDAVYTDKARVVNIFLECRDYGTENSRLTVLNLNWLSGNNILGTLRCTSREARAIATAYVDSRSLPHWNRSIISHLGRGWTGPGTPYDALRELYIDPARDVLFLNGLDVDFVPKPRDSFLDKPFFRLARSNEGMNPLFLPNWVLGLDVEPTRRTGHFRNLSIYESLFTSQFSTIIMPIHGLVQLRQTERVFTEPFWARTADVTFIALFGQYRGRNLQLGDLEFISDDQIGEMMAELHLQPGRWVPGTGRMAAPSIEHRDLVTLMGVYDEWAHTESPYSHIFNSHNVFPIELDMPRFRFARVREEVLRGLSPEEMYWSEASAIV
jgi:hypothetical protein